MNFTKKEIRIPIDDKGTYCQPEDDATAEAVAKYVAESWGCSYEKIGDDSGDGEEDKSHIDFRLFSLETGELLYFLEVRGRDLYGLLDNVKFAWGENPSIKFDGIYLGINKFWKITQIFPDVYLPFLSFHRIFF